MITDLIYGLPTETPEKKKKECSCSKPADFL